MISAIFIFLKLVFQITSKFSESQVTSVSVYNSYFLCFRDNTTFGQENLHVITHQTQLVDWVQLSSAAEPNWTQSYGLVWFDLFNWVWLVRKLNSHKSWVFNSCQLYCIQSMDWARLGLIEFNFRMFDWLCWAIICVPKSPSNI